MAQDDGVRGAVSRTTTATLESTLTGELRLIARPALPTSADEVNQATVRVLVQLIVSRFQSRSIGTHGDLVWSGLQREVHIPPQHTTKTRGNCGACVLKQLEQPLPGDHKNKKKVKQQERLS